jgi:hypothetical protein
MTIKELVAEWPEIYRDEWAERAAIIQFDGKQSVQNAEGMAYRQMLKTNRDLLPKGKQ